VGKQNMMAEKLTSCWAGSIERGGRQEQNISFKAISPETCFLPTAPCECPYSSSKCLTLLSPRVWSPLCPAGRRESNKK
jgi:hypothetical protein